MDHASCPPLGPITAVTPGTHSRACANCARAKAKCITIPGGSKCGRCDRLNKFCQPAVSIRKPKTAKKTPTNSTARLEEKLDGLFSLLRSGAQPKVLSGYPSSNDLDPRTGSRSDTQSDGKSGSEATLVPESSALSYQELLCSVATNGAIHDTCIASTDPRTGRLPDTVYRKDIFVNPPENFFEPGRSAATSSAPTPYPTPDSTTSSYPYPSLDDARIFLNIFEDRMLKNFPFMKMPSYKNPYDFRNQYPFLFLCIMAVTSRSTEQQVALGKEIRSILGRKMFVESERSLDLLFGLLVYSGWSQTHIHTNPIVTNLVQLAIGLLGDLGLKRAPLKQAPSLILNYDVREYGKAVPAKRTNEERRVAIGVFLLSSVLSAHFQKIEPLRWTSYLEDCLQSLREGGDCATDPFLVYLVRLQLLTEKALSLTSHDDLGILRSLSHLQTDFYMKNLRAQLEAIKQDIPSELQQNEALLMQIYTAELSIHEIALSSVLPTTSAPNFGRSEAFFACLRATKNWYDVFLAMPPIMWTGFAMPIFCQLAHCSITLYRLSTLEAVDWDKSIARETLDYSVMMGDAIKRMKQVKEAAGLDVGILEDLDVYSLSARRFQAIRDWWDAKVAMEEIPPTIPEEAKDNLSTEFLDNAWLRDIMGMGWEEYQVDYMQTL